MSTTMWQCPGFNEDLLNKYGCFDDIYKALGSSDLSDIVVTALEVLNKTGTVPLIKVEKKSEAISTDFRKKGNEAYRNKKYQEALILYNKALQYAPVDSKAMKLAFSNRSALFMTVKAYGACMGDIDIVFDMYCPPEILAKLEQRHKEASNAMRSEDSHWKTLPKSGNTFCTLKEMPNPQIACATKNVGVFMENEIPKIVAANHVKVGTVLAIEPAFVSYLDPGNLMVACYYCHKLDYNLVPCEGCCHVMFCNEYCMQDSMDQYHSVECNIMDLLHYIDCDETLRLAIKAAIKMKLKHSSWENFIASTKLFGVERMKKSPISLIFSHSFSSSLLHLKEERHFVYGAMYNASFKIAALIHYLGLETDFFPEFNERCEAIKCFGRIVMYLFLYGNPILIVNAVSINDAPQVEFHKLHNFGFFSFTGQLKNSCMPNVMSVGLNDKVALVALEPISRGTELTIAYTGHWLDKITKDDNKLGRQNMFVLYSTVCSCVICSGAWKRRTSTLTSAQRHCYNKICLQEPIDFMNFPKLYKNLCRAVTILHNVPFSQEYIDVYRLFRTCILHFQHVASENIVLEHARPTGQ